MEEQVIEKFKKLAESKSSQSRINVANSKDCPKEVLEMLSNDSVDDVLIAVAGNKNCSSETLDKLADHHNINVLYAVIKNKNCSLETFKKLIKHPDKRVRIKIPEYAPQEIIRELLEDKDIEVVNSARNNYYPEDLIMYDFYHSSDQTIRPYEYTINGSLWKILFVEALFSSKGNKTISKMTKQQKDKLERFIEDSIVDSGYAAQRYIWLFHRKKDLFFWFPGSLSLKVKSMEYSGKGGHYWDKHIINSITEDFPSKSRKISTSLNLVNGNDIELLKYISSASYKKQKDAADSDYVKSQNPNNGSCAVLNCDDIDSIKLLGNDIEIEFGEYPQDNVSLIETILLEALFKLGALEKTYREYPVFKHLGLNDTYQEYTIKGRKFIRLGYRKFIEVTPIKWKIDGDKLTSTKEIFSGNIDENILNEFYENSILRGQKEPDRTSLDEKLIAKKQIEENKIERMKMLEDQIIDMLNQMKNITDVYEETSSKKMTKRIKINEDLLLKIVEDHFEINEKYIPYLKYIDFSFVSFDNVKVSNTDFRGSNAVINPQIVYKKDLSNSSFDDNNIVWASFKGCDLRGTNLENEMESCVFEDAILDNNTRLPNSKKM